MQDIGIRMMCGYGIDAIKRCNDVMVGVEDIEVHLVSTRNSTQKAIALLDKNEIPSDSHYCI